MAYLADFQTSKSSLASATRWAIPCLILAVSAAAAAAVPTLATLNRTVSSESEMPLESDDSSVEAALPRSSGHQWRLKSRRAKTNIPRVRFYQLLARQGCRSRNSDGHRLANGLPAPLRC